MGQASEEGACGFLFRAWMQGKASKEVEPLRPFSCSVAYDDSANPLASTFLADVTGIYVEAAKRPRGGCRVM